jgi:hypothetical protein
MMPEVGGGLVTSEGAPLLALAAGRLPDGEALVSLLEGIAASGQVPTEIALSSEDESAVVDAARAWIAWRSAVIYTAPASAWADEQLEYHFDVAVQPPAGGAFALSAPWWDGDRLDWHDMDVDRRVAPPSRPAGASAPPPLPDVDPATGVLRADGLPSPLAYPGMPASRCWQFEDANVNLAQVTAAPDDLARMLVVEFASVYGNDWYLWPLDLSVGAVHRVTKLEVDNTFGDVATVGPVPSSAGGSTTIDWQLFRPTEHTAGGGSAAFDGLVLLPSLASPLDGDVFEEVRFFRDELANLAWAVEATVLGEDALPFDRHSAAAAAGELPAPAPAPATGDTQPMRFKFATDVPVYWFPLAPDPTGAPTFDLLVLSRADEAGDEYNVMPEGEVLAPPGFWLWQEEVPREGARVRRRYRMARGSDGALYVWRARRSSVGMGEGSSGLRYDDAIPMPEVPTP